MNLQAAPGKSRAGPPAHEVVYRALRDRILFGELAPGQAVTIQGLTAELGAGMTPVREAIRRLMAEGALNFRGNRRVAVPVLQADDLAQLAHARLSLEPELARLACGTVTDADIADLTRIDSRLDAAIQKGDVRSYLEENHNFHQTLNALAAAPILSGIVDGLWLRFGPSLRVVCGRFGTQNLPDRHKELLRGLSDRDPEAVAQAMHKDVQQGIELMREALKDD